MGGLYAKVMGDNVQLLNLSATYFSLKLVDRAAT